MLKKLIAIDPGKMSGLALFDYTDSANPVLVMSAELGTPELQAWLTENLPTLLEHSELTVVFERFKITPQTGKNTDAPFSLEHIGVIKYLCRLRNVTWTEQTPADAKNFAPNERLKALGFWHVGGAGHANDAIRHGILWMVRNSVRPPGLVPQNL